MKRSIKKHTKIYITVFSSLLALLFIAATVLWTVLDAYEKTRPQHTAEEIFDKYFTSYNIAEFLRASNPDFKTPQSDESINSTVKSYYAGKELALIQLDSEAENEEKYAVAADNKQIASFVLRKTDKSAKYGFKFYTLCYGNIDFPEYHNVTAAVPVGYTLKVNGIAVDRAFLTQTDIKDKSCDYVLPPAEGIKYEEYTVNKLFTQPTVSAFAPDGTEVPVSFDMTNGMLKASLKYDDRLSAEYSGYCLDAARAYAEYMTTNGTFQDLAAFLDKSKPIYKQIKGVDLNWVPVHTGYSISNESATEFYRYSDEIFSCRVNLKITLMRPDYKDHNENIDVIFYLVKSGEKYLIYDIITNS